MNNPIDKIDEILTRGVANIISDKDSLKKLLLSGKKLNIYFGVDPTATAIHLGNSVPLRKLQKFVELGHNITFLIGDFTALIGDTSDKDSERPVLTYEQIQENFKTYKQQAEKILDFTNVKLVHNSEWLGKLNFTEIVKLCQHFSAGDFISRELIRKRLDEGKRVGLHEVLYPVMQGFDSYHLNTDLQIGGTDQTYNMQAGRTLQKDMRNKESFVLSTPFLMGTDGRKMSKSWGNAIWLTDSATDIFGKVMSIKDDLLLEYFTLATDVPLSEIPDLSKPMEAKKQLANSIVSQLHSPEAAAKAQAEFEAVFQGRGVPEDIPSITISQPSKLSDLLLSAKLVASNSEFKRLVSENGIKLNGETISDPLIIIQPFQKITVKVGKLRFLQIN